MATIDKYQPDSGGHRAPLAFAVLAADLRKVIAVGLDANGRVVKGAGNTGVIGVLVLTKVKNIGDIVDIMQDGEIVECEGLAAGTRYYGEPDGDVVNASNAGANKPLGWTVEATRLIVRVGK